MQLLCISGAVVSQCPSVKASGGHFEHCFWFRHCSCSNNCDLSWCRWQVEQLHANRPVWFNCSCQLTLCFAIIGLGLHGDCFISKVKYWHWLGVADFCSVNSFALPSFYFLQKYNYMFEFFKVMSKVLSRIVYKAVALRSCQVDIRGASMVGFRFCWWQKVTGSICAARSAATGAPEAVWHWSGKYFPFPPLPPPLPFPSLPIPSPPLP